MSQPETNSWQLIYNDWNPQQQPLREALCTLGNGYFATRGAAEEVAAGDGHYPGTYLAGGYNRLQTEIAGRTVENEDFVNWPNWLCLTFRPEGGAWFHIDHVELLDFRQILDVRDGVLERRVRFRDSDDRESTLSTRRLVHMAHPHLGAVEWTLTPQNWSGTVEIHTALDGGVTNAGVARYRDLHSRHLEILESEPFDEDGLLLRVRTNQSHIVMAQAARTRAFADGESVADERQLVRDEQRIGRTLRVDCRKGKSLRVEKTAAIYTSRDHAISEPALEARKTVRRAGCFAELLESHRGAWSRIWHRCDIQFSDDSEYAQFVLRLHIFHLLQTTSPNTIDLDVGVPARGLHGEAYRGHIFWDELFIFPFLNLRIPNLTRSLLMYRYRRLPEARQAAREAGYAGAMFPWQSGSNGREESQTLHLNPQSGRWIPDNTHRQRHVGAAVAYNVWQYFQATEDRHFLNFCGAEMLLEIARFWASIAEYNSERERYEIRHVVGPDEFHTGYPDSDEPGLRNNAYTNIMAAWVIHRADEALTLLDEDRRRELIEKLDITDTEMNRWQDVGSRMFVPFHDEGVISQFEGYENLQELDWEGYREKYGDIQRLDRVLEAENDSPNRYKAGKQADVLMLFHLFSCEELIAIFDRLGYAFEPAQIPRNIEYYRSRTSHGSTLSRVVHSWVLSRSERGEAWDLFQEALQSDIADIQGGTTSEGIHLGAMAGTVDIVQRCYTGIEMRENVLWLNPCLPGPLAELNLRIHYRGHWLRLRVRQDSLMVSFEQGGWPSVTVGYRGQTHTFAQGETVEFKV